MTEAYHFDPIHSVRWRVKYAQQLARAQMERERAWRFYMDLIKPGDLVFDVGANIGKRTRMFRGLGARVISLEPVKETHAQLMRNTRDLTNIAALNLGVSDHVGPATIKLNRISTICSMEEEWIEGGQKANPVYKWEGNEDIYVTTLDRLINLYGLPKFIKIDVEGHELPVLRGLSRSVPGLSFEYTPWRIDPAFECLDRLEALGKYRYDLIVGETFRPLFGRYVSRSEIEKAVGSCRGAKCAGDVYAVRCGA